MREDNYGKEGKCPEEKDGKSLRAGLWGAGQGQELVARAMNTCWYLRECGSVMGQGFQVLAAVGVSKVFCQMQEICQ